MPVLPVLKGIGSAIGKIAPAVLDVFGRRQQNQAQRAEARRAEAFAERMSSTAAQRSRADFEAAGLNPALSYGYQASSPGGVQASIGNELGTAVSSAQAARLASQQVQMVQEQLSTQKAVTSKARAEAESSQLQADRQRMEQMVWRAIGSGQSVDLSSPLARSIKAQFEASALAPDSIAASNSALSAQARAQGVTADVQQFERDFLQRMQTDKGNVSKFLNMIVPLMRLFK